MKVFTKCSPGRWIGTGYDRETMRHHSNDGSIRRRDASELHPCIASQTDVTKSFFTKWKKVILGLLLLVALTATIIVGLTFLLRQEQKEQDSPGIEYVHYDIDAPLLNHDREAWFCFASFTFYISHFEPFDEISMFLECFLNLSKTRFKDFELFDDRTGSASRSRLNSYQVEPNKLFSSAENKLDWSSTELDYGTQIRPPQQYTTAVVERSDDGTITTGTTTVSSFSENTSEMRTPTSTEHLSFHSFMRTTEIIPLAGIPPQSGLLTGFVSADVQETSFRSLSTAVKSDCSAQIGNKNGSGIYLISPDGAEPFSVYCDQVTSGGGWTVIQRRDNTSTYFYNRTWHEYEQGFGDIGGSHWLGLAKIHRLAPRIMESWILRIELHGDTCVGKGCIEQNDGFWWAEWPFKLGGSLSLYVLELGPAIRGNLTSSTDFLMENNGSPFTTIDRDNDAVGVNCAQFRNFGGWWHNGCGHVALNGIYGDTLPSHRYMVYTYSSSKTRGKRYFIHPKKSIMMIRPTSLK
ncbi:fibrinogen beta and gamma chain, globular domain protein [Dictyocaulus viviparus]|uniref:Fibrinogen beta and gamma chain, globular domain protein n=1 Tax=Dictyocaulus viviparus TaxID=29172 RepID=A0A0D8XCR2_DICVI|nr:fibrinogen beta and gamma chain, globular domain protein [Dictyocaulus viviparus]